MNIKEILARVDHTNLNVTATQMDIKTLCDQAMQFGTASVCVPPAYVGFAKKYLTKHGSPVKVCTVVGFPNGYSTTFTKVHETSDAIDNGADEIDMVINLGWLKDGLWDEVGYEISAVRRVCKDKILKVIIETCLLNDEEKIKMCRIVSDSGVDYIKTSTGFSKGGATCEDIALFAQHISNGVKIKAAGGISSFKDAEDMINLGADRLGTSRLVKLALENAERVDVNDSSY